MRRLLFLLLMAPTALRAQSSRWLRISEEGQSNVAIDTLSLRALPTGDVVVWTRHDARPGQKNSSGQQFNHVMRRLALRCLASEMAVTSVAYYDANGQSLSSAENPREDWNFAPTVPESTGESVLRVSCGIAINRGHLK